MSNGKCILFFSLLLIPQFINAQPVRYTLNGSIYINKGKSFPYKLAFMVSGNTLKGFSETTLSKGLKAKATIKGSINTSLHTLTITESTWPEKQKNPLSCFVNAMLNYKLEGKKHTISGTYRGLDIEDMPCGEGTIDFDEPGIPRGLFGIGTTATGEPEAAKETIPGELEITSGVNKHFDWGSDSCLLEIYDGGLVDGDEVTVVLNDKIVLREYPLIKQKKQIWLSLTQKANVIDIVAGYEGKNPPNTVNMILWDRKKQYKLKAYNNAGEKATLTLNRK